jgi:hypothetical protein
MSDTETPPGSAGKDKSVERLVAEARMLLDFACREGLATPEILSKADALERLMVGGPEREAECLAIARSLINDLSEHIRPATAEGVRTINGMSHAGNGTLLGWLKSFRPHRLFVEFCFWGLFAFLALMYYQIFTGSASFAVSTYKDARDQYEEVLSNIAQLKMAEGDKFDEAKYEDIFRRRDYLAGRLASTAKTIETISALEPWPFSQRNSEYQQIQAETVRSNNAHTRLNQSVEMISKYILPILYGFLGASIQVIRQLMAMLDLVSFRRTSLYRFRFRLLLGGVMGGIVSLFVSPDTMTGLNLSVGAGALLAGYSAEAFAMLLDRLVEKIRKAVIGEHGDENLAPAPEAILVESPRPASGQSLVAKGSLPQGRSQTQPALPSEPQLSGVPVG